MSGASLIPVDAPGEHDDVADLLSIARVTWNRGDHAAAVNFVQRAAQTAMELELDLRGMELAKIAAELKASVRPSIPATQTPPLELTPSRPPHQTLPGIHDAPAADRPAMQPPMPSPEVMEDEPATIPLPIAQPPAAAQMLTLSSSDLQDAASQRDTSVDPPPAHAVASPLNRVSASPKPPTVTVSSAPRPSPLSTTAGAAPRARTSGTPPPLPTTTNRPPQVAPKPSNGAPRLSTSPTPPRVASARPPATAVSTTPSRAPLPLRVKTNEPPPVAPVTSVAQVAPVAQGAHVAPITREAPNMTPAPVAVAPGVDASAVRRSAPWIDEVAAPIAAEGGAPVVVGMRARIHFRTDGSLELGPDGPGASGLPVVILPQKGEDMTTILKRLAAKKK